MAEGIIPPGNVSFAIAILLLLAIPLSLQNGTEAGLFLLSDDRRRASCTTAGCTARCFSWVGWSATFALLTYFITFGGWGREADGSAPLPSFVMLSALLGFLVHFLTSLPDLVEDNKPAYATPAAAGRAEARVPPGCWWRPSWPRSRCSPLSSTRPSPSESPTER